MKTSNRALIVIIGLSVIASLGCSKSKMGSNGGGKAAKKYVTKPVGGLPKGAEKKTDETVDSQAKAPTKPSLKTPTPTGSNVKTIIVEEKDSRDGKSGTKSEVKSSGKSDIKVEVVGYENFDNSSAPNSIRSAVLPPTKNDPKVIGSSRANRALKVEIIYANSFEKLNSEVQKQAVAMLMTNADLSNAKVADPLNDYVYGVEKFSSEAKPYVSASLMHDVIMAEACELNTVGPCLIIERDSASGKTVNSAYYIGSAEGMNGSRSLKIARRELAKGKFVPQINALLDSKADGIYVYSAADDSTTAKELVAEAVPVSEVEKADVEIAQSQTQENDYRSYIQSPKTPEEIAEFDRELEEHVKTSAQSSGKSGGQAGFNLCAIVSSPKYGGGLKMVKRFFIADIVRTRTDAQGQKYQLPTKVGKGKVLCRLTDGSRQRMNVLIKDFQALRIGLALNKVKQFLVATGLGWANGAVDIVTMKRYDYLVEADIQALVGGISVNPIVIGDRKGQKPIFAGVVGVVPHWLLANINLTIGGWYEISVDPDDT